MTNPATMTTNELPTLLPCPFCGSKVRFHRSHVASEGGEILHADPVWCSVRFSCLSSDENEALIKDWNTRADSTLSADCAAMREALQKVKLVAHRVDDAGGSTWQCGIIADAALSTTAGTELLAERDALKAKVGRLEDALDVTRSNFTFVSNSLEARNKDALTAEAQRDAAIERVKVLEAELAKKSD